MNALLSDVLLATDLDLFLVGEASASNMQTLERVYDAFRSHVLSGGKFKTVLATRTRASVTFFSSAEEHRRPPPLQVILHVYGSVQELLARFDVARPKLVESWGVVVIAIKEVPCPGRLLRLRLRAGQWEARME